MDLLPRPCSDQPVFTFGSKKVDGRLIPIYFHPEVECHHSGMVALSRAVASRGLVNRWLWQPNDGAMMPDENGCAGVWTLALAGKIPTYVDTALSGTQRDWHQYWVPYWTARSFLFPRCPLYSFEELEFWFLKTFPPFQPGASGEERQEHANQNIRNLARKAFIDNGLKDMRDEFMRTASDNRVIAAHQRAFYHCDPDRRRKVSYAMNLKLQQTELDAIRAIDPTAERGTVIT